MTDTIYIIFWKPRGRGNHKWMPIEHEYFFARSGASMFAAKLTVKYPENKYKIKKYEAV